MAATTGGMTTAPAAETGNALVIAPATESAPNETGATGITTLPGAVRFGSSHALPLTARRPGRLASCIRYVPLLIEARPLCRAVKQLAVVELRGSLLQWNTATHVMGSAQNAIACFAGAAATVATTERGSAPAPVTTTVGTTTGETTTGGTKGETGIEAETVIG